MSGSAPLPDFNRGIRCSGCAAQELGTTIGLGANVPEACKKYPVAGLAPPPAEPRPAGQILQYGTSTPERWNVDEAQAAQAVRAWFAARQAGDPLLLGAFVDQNVVFRTNAAAPFREGPRGPAPDGLRDLRWPATSDRALPDRLRL